MATKMQITVDLDTGKVDSVTDDTGKIYNPHGNPIPTPHRPVGILFTHLGGSNCVTLNIPGGGSYTICH
jgi:hypothetical protein